MKLIDISGTLNLYDSSVLKLKSLNCTLLLGFTDLVTSLVANTSDLASYLVRVFTLKLLSLTSAARLSKTS